VEVASAVEVAASEAAVAHPAAVEVAAEVAAAEAIRKLQHHENSLFIKIDRYRQIA